MLVVQPEYLFGELICEELTRDASGQRKWQYMEFAVAWVNQRGADSFVSCAEHFLEEGGVIRATVGLDFGSTSYEGLVSLLSLEDLGDITTHVFFDENTNCTFHPKLFLFRNETQSLIFVGSNNMTGAGFTTNVEVAIAVERPSDDDLILSAQQTLEGWRNAAEDTRIRRLTHELLAQLKEREYVRTEDEIRKRRKSESAPRREKGERLFGRSTASSGTTHRMSPYSGSETHHPAQPDPSEALLMRVRPRRNGNQVQLSMAIHEGAFMNGVDHLVFTDGTKRAIGYNMARGHRNTARFEASELQGMANPVARFRWIDVEDTDNGKALLVELFDADTHPEGTLILEALLDGITTPPITNMDQIGHGATVLSIANQERAQWYRLT